MSTHLGTGSMGSSDMEMSIPGTLTFCVKMLSVFFFLFLLSFLSFFLSKYIFLHLKKYLYHCFANCGP